MKRTIMLLAVVILTGWQLLTSRSPTGTPIPLIAIAQAQGILYVKPAASGIGDCRSWVDACPLQTALSVARAGDEVWVAAGTYQPGPRREDTFQRINGVAL